MSSAQQIMDSAFRIATTKQVDAHASPIIDAEFLTEDNFLAALQQAVIEQGFERSYSLTLVNGKTALPAGIILEKLSTATVYQEIGELASYEERYIDFLQFIYPQLSAFTVNNSKFCYREPDGDADDFGGTVNLTAVALPDIPTLLTDAIVIPDTLADRCSSILADMLLK